MGLSDTVGYANPAQVKRMFTRLIEAARVRRNFASSRSSAPGAQWVLYSESWKATGELWSGT